jgi:ElaB/YqjD/DUF883 family membrane-anchored ribosome-binding protein
MAETIKHGATSFTTEPKEVLGNVKDKAKEVASGAAGIAGAAKDKAKDLASTAQEKVKDVAKATGDLAAEAKDKVEEWTATAADKTGEAVQEMGKELAAFVRRYPVQSLLIGAAVGYLLARATPKG